MEDKDINEFIFNLMNINFEQELVEKNINLFSKYISYINENYYYNPTYLSKFTAEYKTICENIKIRHEKVYIPIVDRIKAENKLLSKDICILLDGIFEVKNGKGEFRKFNKDVFFSEELVISFEKTSDSYRFVKKFGVMESNGDKKDVSVNTNDILAYILDRIEEKQWI